MILFFQIPDNHLNQMAEILYVEPVMPENELVRQLGDSSLRIARSPKGYDVFISSPHEDMLIAVSNLMYDKTDYRSA